MEADHTDRDRVSSDQGFLIERSGRARSDQGQLSSDNGIGLVCTFCKEYDRALANGEGGGKRIIGGGGPKTVFVGTRDKTPTPKTRFSIWTLLRTPGRFTTRPLPV